MAEKKPSEPNLQERLEGMQGWMAEIERRQGRMTYFGAAACGLAVLAAAAALYLALSVRSDSATKDDLDELQEQVSGIQQEVKQATETELKGVNETLGSLDQRIEDLKQKQAQDAEDIAQLQNRVSSAATTGPAAEAQPGASATTRGATGGQTKNQPGP